MKPPALLQPGDRVQLFTSVDEIEVALNDLADYLTKENYQSVLTDLVEHPLVIELVLSGIRDSVPLTSWIFEDFPTSINTYKASIASKLLNHLSLFFVFHPVPITEIQDTRETFTGIHRLIITTPEVLSALSALQFEQEQGEYEEQDHENSMFIKIKTKGQKKRPKRGGNKPARRSKVTLDSRILSKYGISTPLGREETDEAISKVLAHVKNILK
ncbi:hypothetical protein C0991_004136, partial [Blastosporella zonata]